MFASVRSDSARVGSLLKSPRVVYVRALRLGPVDEIINASCA